MNFASQSSPSDLSVLFARFRAVYGLKGAWALKDDSSEEAKTFRDEWWRLLRNTTSDEMRLGGDSWMSGSKDSWPTPGQLYGLILDQRPERKMMQAKDSTDLDDCGCSVGCKWRFYKLENGGMRRTQDCVAKRRHLEPAD